jgi:hypothetical protein
MGTYSSARTSKFCMQRVLQAIGAGLVPSAPAELNVQRDRGVTALEGGGTRKCARHERRENALHVVVCGSAGRRARGASGGGLLPPGDSPLHCRAFITPSPSA